MTPFATTLAPWQACHLWAELEDARHGKASHGDEAEVYAYRLLPSEAIRDAAQVARDALIAVGRAFEARYEVTIKVDGGWTLDQYVAQAGFTHRVLVRVVHGKGGAR